MLTKSKLLTKFLRLCLPIIILSITGCAKTETNVTLYANENWEGELSIELPAETVALVGGRASLEERLDEELSKVEDGDVALDLEREFRDDGSFLMKVGASGTGFDELNRSFFDNSADITAAQVNGQRHVTIRQTLTNVGVGSNTVRITGAEIIDSNADMIDGNTAVWHNPSRIEVTLVEDSQISWWLWGIGLAFGGMICIGFIGLVGLGGFFVYRQRQAA